MDDLSSTLRTLRRQGYSVKRARSGHWHVRNSRGRLVAVSICDEAPRAWSLVYFFFDPAYADRSLGVANVVLGVEIAAARGIPYVYLGYAVEGCPSLAYKRAVGPREELVGWPRLDERPQWVRAGQAGCDQSTGEM